MDVKGKVFLQLFNKSNSIQFIETAKKTVKIIKSNCHYLKS